MAKKIDAEAMALARSSQLFLEGERKRGSRGKFSKEALGDEPFVSYMKRCDLHLSIVRALIDSDVTFASAFFLIGFSLLCLLLEFYSEH
jgi:hypothetical protein